MNAHGSGPPTTEAQQPDDTDHRFAGARASGVLWMAVRYALGRATYATGEVADAIHAHADGLPEWMRLRIADEIEQEIDADRAGMGCDVDNWRRAIRRLRGGAR